jgi:endoglucanase
LRKQKPFLPLVILVSSLVLCAGGCARRVEPEVPEDTPTPTPEDTPTPEGVDPFEQNACLGRGVNLGNALEAPREGEWGVVLQEKYFQLIEEAGFDAVRIPIRWSAHAAPTAPYTIDDVFFERVDWAVDQALARGLLVVINMHHYEGIMEDPAGHEERFLALWAQIADHYRSYPDALLFEVLNEPHDRLTSSKWNDLLREGIDTIRETNPARTLVVGPANWNSIDGLGSLDLPAQDRNIIVTVHYYNPFHFTHQGADWVSGSGSWLGTTWQGTDSEKRAVARDLGLAASWGEANDRPIYLGEFGAYSLADMDSRVLWTEYVARQAEEYGMSWAYWEFCAGFGVFDKLWDKWNEGLVEALVPSQ